LSIKRLGVGATGETQTWQKTLRTWISVYTLRKTVHIENRITVSRCASLFRPFYQYLDSIPISKRCVNRFFYEMLRESGFSWIKAKAYHLAVWLFGELMIYSYNDSRVAFVAFVHRCKRTERSIRRFSATRALPERDPGGDEMGAMRPHA
ncbi:MAG: hypothetical protein ACREX9_03175, partial [Gammaproteobacteria bacterium]